MLSYLGLAARGRRIASGEFSVEKAVKAMRASLVIIAGDASENTRKKFTNMCEFYEVPCFVCENRDSLGKAIGCGDRTTVAILDQGLADAVRKLMAVSTAAQ